MLPCRILGHRYRFAAEGTVLRWRCVRCGGAGGSKVYATGEEARGYAAGLNREDRQDLGHRAPPLGLLPLRLAYRLRRQRR